MLVALRIFFETKPHLLLIFICLIRKIVHRNQFQLERISRCFLSSCFFLDWFWFNYFFLRYFSHHGLHFPRYDHGSWNGSISSNCERKDSRHDLDKQINFQGFIFTKQMKEVILYNISVGIQCISQLVNYWTNLTFIRRQNEMSKLVKKL